MNYRPLTAVDQPAYRALRLLGLDLYPQNFLYSYEEEAARSADDQATLLEQGNMRGMVAADGALVAMSALVPEGQARTAHRAYIGAFIVHPDFHGQGVARELLVHLKAEAKARGIWQLELFVNEQNNAAITLYEAQGFARMGKLPNAIQIGDRLETDLFMVCDLRD